MVKHPDQITASVKTLARGNILQGSDGSILHHFLIMPRSPSSFFLLSHPGLEE
jgi:hypothetical protein